MAGTYVPLLLSNSTDGAPVKVAATATAGTLIHTATASTTGWDQLFLDFANTHTDLVTVTVEWGGATDPDNLIVRAYELPPASPPVRLIDGHQIRNGLTVRVFASVANKIIVNGYGRRYTP
jgi:hypothetical protein